VAKFCYLGDILSVDGDADAAVEVRILIGWINSSSWYHCLSIWYIIEYGRETVQQLCAK